MPAKLLMQSELLIGNPKSNIALCTLWSKREEIASQLDKKNFFACGNLYSFDGINSLLRNIFLNPSIRFLVVTGKDLNGSGEALLLFFSKGVDAGHYIIGTRHCIERELPSEKLELLRQSVKALDFRNSGIQELKETLAGISKQKTTPFSEPLVFPSSIPSAEALSSEQAGFLVRDSSISNAWLKIVSLIMRFGSEKPSEYGLKQKELINVVAVVNPLDENIPAFIGFSKKELEEYLPSILSPQKPESISYTYGSRLFGSDSLLDESQVSSAIRHLKEAPHTRRALAFTWRIEKDTKSSSAPCLTQISWLVQSGRLFQTVFFRSHDIFAGWPLNLFALAQLQKKIAGELGIAAGELTCISSSAHIYENKWAAAKNLAEEHLQNAFSEFVQDPRGSFYISIQASAGGREIVAEHFSADGKKTGYCFKGKSAIEVFGQIEKNNLVSMQDHAFYLGKELKNAEIALKSGKPYRQDFEF